MKRKPKAIRLTLSALFLASAASFAGCSGDVSRDSIRAVGSSTVYPFAKLIAESFALSNPDYKSPLIESTGTGGGIQLFARALVRIRLIWSTPRAG